MKSKYNQEILNLKFEKPQVAIVHGEVHDSRMFENITPLRNEET